MDGSACINNRHLIFPSCNNVQCLLCHIIYYYDYDFKYNMVLKIYQL